MLDAADGELQLRTGVKGRAARMGHRLTIEMTRWQATVRWAGSDPVSAELAVEADSFEVVGSQGGVKGLGSRESAGSVQRVEFAGRRSLPHIRFFADVIEASESGYLLTGMLQLHGKQREHVIDLHTEDLGDSWRMSAESTVRQSDYGIKPYSLLMGAVQVADDVTLTFSAVHAKDD